MATEEDEFTVTHVRNIEPVGKKSQRWVEVNGVDANKKKIVSEYKLSDVSDIGSTKFQASINTLFKDNNFKDWTRMEDYPDSADEASDSEVPGTPSQKKKTKSSGRAQGNCITRKNNNGKFDNSFKKPELDNTKLISHLSGTNASGGGLIVLSTPGFQTRNRAIDTSNIRESPYVKFQENRDLFITPGQQHFLVCMDQEGADCLVACVLMSIGTHIIGFDHNSILKFIREKLNRILTKDEGLCVGDINAFANSYWRGQFRLVPINEINKAKKKKGKDRMVIIANNIADGKMMVIYTN